MITKHSSAAIDDLVQQVDHVKAHKCGGASLIHMLSPRAEVYRGCSSREAARIKGYTLAALELGGLPESALPFVLEELESGADPYLVAGAAKALRGYSSPHPEFADYLVKAIYNIMGHDDQMSFAEFRPSWPLDHPTTALREIVATMQWLGPDAKSAVDALRSLHDEPWNWLSQDIRQRIGEIIEQSKAWQPTKRNGCCCSPFQKPPAQNRAAQLAIREIELQDQDGCTKSFAQRFAGQVTVVAFFYTRCNNPQKCSLTISKLAKLQQLASAGGAGDPIGVAAITYDPQYDLPNRLRVFGQERGFQFNDHGQLLRAVSGHQQLIDGLNLQVNFSGSIVNQHAIELFILDRRGRVMEIAQRLQWSPDELLARAIVVSRGRGGTIRSGGIAAYAMGGSSALVLALMPKCPLCWSAYLSFFGLSAIQGFASRSSVIIASLLLVAIYLAVIGRRSWLGGTKLPFLISCCGIIGLIVAMTYQFGWQFRLASLSFMLIGSLLTASIHQPRRPTTSPAVAGGVD